MPNTRAQNAKAMVNGLEFAGQKDVQINLNGGTFFFEGPIPQPHEWLIVFDCPGCKTVIPVVHDPNLGRKGILIAGPGSLVVECPGCREDRTAEPTDLRVLKWPAA